MDKHEQDIIKLANDPEQAARIVTNIAQVERDGNVAVALGERFMAEAEAALAVGVESPWKIIATDSGNLLLDPEWKKQSRGVGHGDVWLELNEVSSDDTDYGWIAVATRSGQAQLVLEVSFRKGLLSAAQSVFADPKAMAALLKLGFATDEAKEQLFVPIEIPVAVLAKGVRENDLSAAVAPVSKAVALAMAAKAELDTLIAAVRAKAKIN